LKYIDEYRDERLARTLVVEIARWVTRPWVLMEIRWGQTHTVMRCGIGELPSSRIELVHGPGCTVCVSALQTTDQAIQLVSHSRPCGRSWPPSIRRAQNPAPLPTATHFQPLSRLDLRSQAA
jgi:hydrogenase expression/formation protein HypD